MTYRIGSFTARAPIDPPSDMGGPLDLDLVVGR